MTFHSEVKTHFLSHHCVSMTLIIDLWTVQVISRCSVNTNFDHSFIGYGSLCARMLQNLIMYMYRINDQVLPSYLTLQSYNEIARYSC